MVGWLNFDFGSNHLRRLFGTKSIDRKHTPSPAMAVLLTTLATAAGTGMVLKEIDPASPKNAPAKHALVKRLEGLPPAIVGFQEHQKVNPGSEEAKRTLAALLAKQAKLTEIATK